MTNLLKEAIERVSALPDAAQQSIAEDLISHVENVEYLRAEIQKGIDSFERDGGLEVDIEELIKTARTQYERR